MVQDQSDNKTCSNADSCSYNRDNASNRYSGCNSAKSRSRSDSTSSCGS